MSEDKIAGQLERDRLEHHLQRFNIVIPALRASAVDRRTALGATPGPLLAAIASFEIEREHLRRRLRRARACAEPADGRGRLAHRRRR